ncbi:MAG: phage tail tape measure protein, partial [Chloroflexota bacterium]|nr:phage tail tape measure protein [Chloroflexota bacterium]
MAIEAARLKVVVGADTAQAEAGMARVNQKMGGLGAKATAAGAMISAGVTAPLIGMASTAIKSVASFETNMNLLQAASDASGQQMKVLQQRAIDLGNDMSLPGTSASDAGQAMLELTKAGMSVNDTLAASKGVLQLSAAANIDNARAAEIASNALNAFGLKGGYATEVANQLANVANASSVEITDVADSMKMASAVFASFQGPVVGSEKALTDLNTAIGILGNVGIKGSDAGTSLKQMLLQLTGPSGKSKDAMKALALAAGNVPVPMGLLEKAMGKASERGNALKEIAKLTGGDLKKTGDIAYDASGRMRPLQEIIDLVAKGTKGMADEQRNAYLTQIFGADATRAVIALMKAGPKEFDRMSQAVRRQGGAAAMANARMKGLAGAWEGFKSSMETTLLEAGLVALPFLTGLARAAGDAVGVFSALPAPVKAAAVAIGAVLAVAGPLLVAIPLLAPAFAALMGPVGLVVGGIALLAAGVAALAVAWKQNLGGIRDKAGAVFGWLKQTFGPLFSTISSTVKGLTATFGESGFIGVLRAIPDALRRVSVPLRDLAGRLVSWVRGAVPQIASAVMRWGAALVNWVGPRVPELLRSLARLMNRFGAWLTSTALPTIKSKLTMWGTAFVQWVEDTAPVLATNLTTFLGGMLRWVKDKGWPAIKSGLTRWASAFSDWVENSLGPFLANAATFLAGLLKWAVETALPSISRKLYEWAKAFWAWVKVAMPPLLRDLGSLLLEVGTWIIETALPAIAQKLAKWGAAIVDWVEPRIQPLLKALGGLLKDLGDWIVDTALPVIGEKLGQWASAFLDWVEDSVLPFLGEKLAAIGTAIKNWIVGENGSGGLARDMLNWAATVGTSFLGWVASAITDLPTRLGDLLTDIKDWIVGQDGAGGLAKKFLGWGASLASNMWNGLVNWFKNAGSEVKQALSDAIKSLLPSFNLKNMFSGRGAGPTGPSRGAPPPAPRHGPDAPKPPPK